MMELQRNKIKFKVLEVFTDQGRHYGWSRIQCDETFQRDMKKLCGKNWLCRRAADLYFVSVRVAGKSFFKAATPPWCLASCAKDLGDPNGSR